MTNDMGDSYNYSKDINKNKNEMGFRKKRALFGLRFKKEDEKEMEEGK